MISYLDANYLIRYLANDVPKLVKKAVKIIEGSKNLYIAPIVLAETVYILENFYDAKKGEVYSSLSVIIKQENIITPKFCLNGLDIYKNENISFYDSLLVAEVLENKGKLISFDEKLNKIFKKYRGHS
jgi:predicted nucleic-acid-binding protein